MEERTLTVTADVHRQLGISAAKIRDALALGHEALIDVGRELAHVRDLLILSGDSFSDWCAREFDWSRSTAYRLIALAERAEREANLPQLLDGWGDDMAAERRENHEALDRQAATERAQDVQRQDTKQQTSIESRVLTLLRRADLAEFSAAGFAVLLDTMKEDK
jgi:hypothetical protein